MSFSKPYIKFGIFGGIVSTLYVLILNQLGPDILVSGWAFLHFIIAFIFSALAILSAKSINSAMTFKRAFGNSFITFMIASAFNIIAYTTLLRTQTEVSNLLIERNTEMLRKNHVSEKAIALDNADMDNHLILGVISITALMSTVGFLGSVLLGALLKNEKTNVQS